MTAEEIRKLRSRLGMTLADMSDVMGVTDMAVSKWERGLTTPDPYKMAALEQLRDRLDRAEADQRRDEFMGDLKSLAARAGIAILLAYLFKDSLGSDE